MGSVGDCYDNAVIESFWSRMQVELLDRRGWRTRVELANAIFEYLEIFHNRQRRHSALGMLTPVEFETRHQSATVAWNPVSRLHATQASPGSPPKSGRFRRSAQGVGTGPCGDTRASATFSFGQE